MTGLGVWLLGSAGWLGCLGLLARDAIGRRSLRRRLAHSLHELRGPLGTVAMGLESARRRGGLRRREVDGLELAVRRAALALEDLERVPRSQARHLTATQDVIELPALIHACVREAAAGAGGRTLQIAAAPGLVVRGDRIRLAQAIGNLIANAVEHGEGTVTVTARSGGETVRVEVSDEGDGLPAPLSALQRSGGHRRGGARGHGLSIVRAIARVHGGELRSAPSARGARLVLVLPAARAAAPRAS